MTRQLRQVRACGVVVLVGLMLLGCAAMTGRQSAGEAVSDSAITTKVKTNLLGDSVLGATAIDVDTTAGVVVLNGIMRSAQERQRAIQIAQSVEGVKRVDGRNLMVRR
jgi:osmotically-inducible protein OsmY